MVRRVGQRGRRLIAADAGGGTGAGERVALPCRHALLHGARVRKARSSSRLRNLRLRDGEVHGLRPREVARARHRNGSRTSVRVVRIADRVVRTSNERTRPHRHGHGWLVRRPCIGVRGLRERHVRPRNVLARRLELGNARLSSRKGLEVGDQRFLRIGQRVIRGARSFDSGFVRKREALRRGQRSNLVNDYLRNLFVGSLFRKIVVNQLGRIDLRAQSNVLRARVHGRVGREDLFATAILPLRFEVVERANRVSVVVIDIVIALDLNLVTANGKHRHGEGRIAPAVRVHITREPVIHVRERQRLRLPRARAVLRDVDLVARLEIDRPTAVEVLGGTRSMVVAIHADDGEASLRTLVEHVEQIVRVPAVAGIHGLGRIMQRHMQQHENRLAVTRRNLSVEVIHEVGGSLLFDGGCLLLSEPVIVEVRTPFEVVLVDDEDTVLIAVVVATRGQPLNARGGLVVALDEDHVRTVELGVDARRSFPKRRHTHLGLFLRHAIGVGVVPAEEHAVHLGISAVGLDGGKEVGNVCSALLVSRCLKVRASNEHGLPVGISLMRGHNPQPERKHRSKHDVGDKGKHA